MRLYDPKPAALSGLWNPPVVKHVAEFVPDPEKYQHKADITLGMSGETWVKLYLSAATPEDLIKKGEIKVTGNATEAAKLLNLFERYKPEKAVVIPPAYLEHAM